MKKLAFLLVLVLTLQSCAEDDQMVDQCESVSNQVESDLDHMSVTLNWQDSNMSTSFNLEYGLSGFQPGMGNTINISDVTVELSGLSANTTYDYYIETVCATNNTSILSAVRSFTTLPDLVVPEFRPYLF